MGLGNTIVDENDASNQDRAKAMIFLRRHLDEGLKVEYLTVKDPLVLWRDLKERFDHLKLVIFPKARYDWLHLRLQDFKSVDEYHSAMFRITSQLSLCGEKVTDENIGGRGRGRDRERDRSRFMPRENYRRSKQQNISQERENDYYPKEGEKKVYEEKCYQCGMEGHWSRTCRTAEHLVDLYQASLKKKDKHVETNFIDQKDAYDDDDADMTHLDVADFFEHPEDAK
nr:uncharacterized protein LOC113715843 [Coffea arabica]